MDNYNYIRENYKKTVVRLNVAVKECATNPSDLMIDGLIQRFEFASDFALKSCGDYMDTAGHRIEGEAKVVIQKATDIGLLEDSVIWNKIVADRNTTSQIYDKAAARRVANNVSREYLPHFQSLAKKFS